MQFWESEIGPWPCCDRCRGGPGIHRHGQCWRKAADGLRIGLQRYRCPWCRRTASALKAGMLPYRRIGAEVLQQALDEPDPLKQDQAKPSRPLRSGSPGLSTPGASDSEEQFRTDSADAPQTRRKKKCI